MHRSFSLMVIVVALAVPALAPGQSSDLATYTLFGGTQLLMGAQTTVLDGNVGSNGAVVLKSQANIGASCDLAGNVIGGSGFTVAGDIFYNRWAARGATLSGQLHSPIAVPFVTLPPPPSVLPPSSSAVVVARNGSVVLDPGQYPSIVAGNGTTVVLRGGQYDVDQLVVQGKGTRIMCDLVPATCTVRVQSKLALAAAQIGGTDGPPRGAISFEFAGLRAVSLGRPGAYVETTVVAPLAVVKLNSSRVAPSSFIGHFVGAQVRISGATTIRTAPPVCGDGIVDPPSEQCDPPVDTACPGRCLPDCTCGAVSTTPILHSVGPSVLNNATSFGVQIFGANFLPGAQLELSDRTTTAVIEVLPTTFVSQTEITARVPAGMPVLSGIQRELVAKVINPGNQRSGPPDIGHCTVDSPTAPTVCTTNADCATGTGPCITGDQRLTMFNDAVFLNPNSAAVVPLPYGVCDDGRACQGNAGCAGIGLGVCVQKVYVTPQQRDELWVYDTNRQDFVDKNPTQSGIQGIPVGDNPFHVEILNAGGVVRAWVVNRFDDSFSIIDPATDTELVRVTGASLGVPGRLRMETEVEFNRAGTRAYLTNENLDEVQVLDISGARRDAPVLITTIDVGVNPRGMATNAADTKLYVANIQSADISVVDIAPGSPTENHVVKTIGARATDDIVGGRADGWEPFVIGGRAPRGIVFSDARNAVFVTSIGPQTGPRAGVQLIGGSIVNPTITVIDAATDTIRAHVALNGLDRDRPTCTDPELMAVDDGRGRLYVTCQGSGVVDVLDTAALVAGIPAELTQFPIDLPPNVSVSTLSLNPQAGNPNGVTKSCAAFTSNAGTACTSDANCTGCPATRDGVPVVCCATNNPPSLHNGPRGIAFDGSGTLFVVNQFTTSVSRLVPISTTPFLVLTSTTAFPGPFGSDNQQRDRRLGQIEFFTDVKKTNISCATCHIDDHQDGVFFEADVAGPRLRRVLSVRGTRDTPPLLQDQLLPDLVAFTDIVVHVERGGPVCTPCTELNGSFFCFPGPEGTCTLTSNLENQQNTAYAKAVTFFPNPNLNSDGSFATTVPLPGGHTGNAVRGEAVFDQLACATCHPDPLFTLDQFRVFTASTFSTVQSRRMREVSTPVILPLRAKCQDANRPTGVDGSSGFGVPSLRGIWDTFPLLMSGSAGMQVVGSDPTFTSGCTPGSSGCCTQLRSPLNPSGTVVPEEHLAVGTKDPIRALLTSPLAVPGSGHGAALALSASDLDALIAYLRSL